MEESQIPEDLRQFILVHCASVPHLEALLLLHRDPQREWTTAPTASRLYIDEKRAAEILNDLAAVKLAAFNQASGSWRYSPGSLAEADLVDRLSVFYSGALVAVTNLIHSRSAELFAAAFRFRKE